jgi:hypothetical protein
MFVAKTHRLIYRRRRKADTSPSYEKPIAEPFAWRFGNVLRVAFTLQLAPFFERLGCRCALSKPLSEVDSSESSLVPRQ